MHDRVPDRVLKPEYSLEELERVVNEAKPQDILKLMKANKSSEGAEHPRPPTSPAVSRRAHKINRQPSSRGDQDRVLALIHLRAALLLNCIEGIKLLAEELRRYAEQEVRLGQVWDWPESKLFNGRERMAFALCDALIVIDEEDFVAEVIRAATVRLGRDNTLAIVFAVSAAVDWHHKERSTFD